MGTDQRRPLFLPLTVIVIGGALSFWLWQATTLALNNNFLRLLNNSARLHAGLLIADLETFSGSAQRIAQRWLALGGTPEDLWREDAVARMTAYAGVIGVERLDADLRLRSEVTAVGANMAMDQLLDFSPQERQRLGTARQNNAVTVSDVRKAPDGAPVIILYAPLHIGERFDGFAGMRVDLKALFAALVKKTGSSNILGLYQNGALMSALSSETPPDSAQDLSGTAPATIAGLAFEVKTQPTAAYLRANGAGIPDFILIIALVITALAAFMTYLILQVSLRSKALRQTHDIAAEQARRYRELLRRAGLGFAVTDFDGKIMEVNEPSLRMAGATSPDAVIGHSIYEFLSAEGAVNRKEYVEHAVRSSDAVQTQTTLLQPGGTQVLISASTIVDEAPDGSARLISLFEDITERNRIQQEIIESKRIYEEVFENADVAINDADMSGMFAKLQDLRSEGVTDLAAYLDEDFARLEELCRLMKVNTMNRAGLRLFGFESVEQVQEIDYFMQSARPAQVREFAIAIWNGVVGLRKEAKYTTFTGTGISLIYSLRLPKSLAEARRVPIVVLDVTDVRSAESARQASLAKSQFLASMSHEIRTPLNGVIGNLELLAQTDLRQDQEELLFDAEKAAKSLLALIGNILDFSKIEAGKLTIESVALNPSAIVQESVDIVQSRARQKGIYITSFVGPDVPEVVRGDPTRIRQILLNLLGNAVKFTAHGGVHLNLKVKDWDGSVCQLLYTVHDSGHGFDQTVAEDLFKPFTQDKKHTTEDFGGTGLGLSICRSLVDTFGGEIACEGVVGEGATFWFTIPVQVLKPAVPPSVPDLKDRLVLFVNADVTDLPTRFAGYLRERGASLFTAPNEENALAITRKSMADEKQIDLAIYLVKRNQWPSSSFADALRECNTVPMIFAPDLSSVTWRKALRSGASYLLPEGADSATFDRNAHQVFGGLSNHVDRSGAREGAGLLDTSLLTNKHALVLEDRLVNQTIIQRQLRKLGMTCSIAGDGVAGLEKLSAGTYDLILCDCSMPQMNGYEFTNIVREREAKGGNQTHIPIIAMTANAFREDREKCFAAGMDDFVSKPVTLHRLASVLSKWIAKGQDAKQTSAAQGPMISEEAPRCTEAIDVAMLQDLIGSTDQRIVADIITEFMTAAQESWRDVQNSVKNSDPREISKAAHGAKGEARNVGAAALGDLYEALEKVAQESRLENIEPILMAIPAELQRVRIFANEIAARAAQ